MRLVPHLFFSNEMVPATTSARLLHSVMSTSRQLINVLGAIGAPWPCRILTHCVLNVVQDGLVYASTVILASCGTAGTWLSHLFSSSDCLSDCQVPSTAPHQSTRWS